MWNGGSREVKEEMVMKNLCKRFPNAVSFGFFACTLKDLADRLEISLFAEDRGNFGI